MFIVYIIKNSKNGRHYIGSTNNIIRRFAEHNRGHTRSTKRGIWEIVYSEEYNNGLEAKRREKIIKSYKGGNAFKRLIARE